MPRPNRKILRVALLCACVASLRARADDTCSVDELTSVAARRAAARGVASPGAKAGGERKVEEYVRRAASVPLESTEASLPPEVASELARLKAEERPATGRSTVPRLQRSDGVAPDGSLVVFRAAFDPPSNNQLAALKKFVRDTGAKEVLIFVDARDSKRAVARRRMAELAFREVPEARFPTHELHKELGKLSTPELLEKLAKRNKSVTLLGDADEIRVDAFTRTKATNIRYVIAKRKNDDLASLIDIAGREKTGSKLNWLEIDGEGKTSQQMLHDFKNGKMEQTDLPPAVAEFVDTHSVYENAHEEMQPSRFISAFAGEDVTKAPVGSRAPELGPIVARHEAYIKKLQDKAETFGFSPEWNKKVLDAVGNMLDEAKISYKRVWDIDYKADSIEILMTAENVARLGWDVDRASLKKLGYCPRCLFVRKASAYSEVGGKFQLSHRNAANLISDWAIDHEGLHIRLDARQRKGLDTPLNMDFSAVSARHTISLKKNDLYGKYLSAQELVTYSRQIRDGLDDLSVAKGIAKIEGLEKIADATEKAVSVFERLDDLTQRMLDSLGKDSRWKFKYDQYNFEGDPTIYYAVTYREGNAEMSIPLSRYERDLYFSDKAALQRKLVRKVEYANRTAKALKRLMEEADWAAEHDRELGEVSELPAIAQKLYETAGLALQGKEVVAP